MQDEINSLVLVKTPEILLELIPDSGFLHQIADLQQAAADAATVFDSLKRGACRRLKSRAQHTTKATLNLARSLRRKQPGVLRQHLGLRSQGGKCMPAREMPIRRKMAGKKLMRRVPAEYALFATPLCLTNVCMCLLLGRRTSGAVLFLLRAGMSAAAIQHEHQLHYQSCCQSEIIASSTICQISCTKESELYGCNI